MSVSQEKQRFFCAGVGSLPVTSELPHAQTDNSIHLNLLHCVAKAVYGYTLKMQQFQVTLIAAVMAISSMDTVNGQCKLTYDNVIFLHIKLGLFQIKP